MNKLNRNLGLVNLLWSIVIFLIAYILFTENTLNPFIEVRYGHAFLSMWQHLLSGSIEIDKATLAGETFNINGKVVAYFLPTPAVFRGLLAAFDLGEFPVISVLMGTIVSMMGLYVFTNSLLSILTRNPSNSNLVIFIPTILAQLIILFIEASIYWEAVIWSLGIFYWLLFFTCKYFETDDKFYLFATCIASSFSLFTRPTYAIAACILIGSIFTFDLHKKNITSNKILAYALFFIALTSLGFLNYARWGSPLEFAPLQFNEAFIENPERIAKLYSLSTISIERIPTAISYYFGVSEKTFLNKFPFILMDDSSSLNFNLYDYMEGRLSLIAALPFLIFLGFIGLFTLISKRITINIDAHRFTILLLVSITPGFLLLTLFSLALRYRAELLPAITAFSIIGLSWLAPRENSLNIKLFALSIFINILGIYFSLNSAIQERTSMFEYGCLAKNPRFICNAYKKDR